MLPPDVFYIEFGDEGNPSEKVASYDLQQAGFLVFQVEHRLAPPGALDGQIYSVNSTGRFPDQTDDIKRQILAALADSQCDGRIYLVGGSAGGSLALWVMLDSSTGFPSFGWNETARTSIKAVVSLSGPTDFCDRTNNGDIDPEEMQKFENALDNYVGLPNATDCSEDPNHKLENASPISLVPDATSSPAVLLYATDGDPVPNEQATIMFEALRDKFPLTDIVRYIMHYTTTDQTNHAYKYWHAQNNAITPSVCVSDQVIEFLQDHP
jgi:acetyl esterase/lipase